MASDKNKKEQNERSNEKVEDLQQKITERDAQTVKGGMAAHKKK